MNLKEFIDARLRPNKKDVGLHTRSQQAGVHVHDNGSVELYAGQSSILLDGTTNTITINAKKLNQVAEKINLRMAAGGLTVPYGIINPQILPTETEALLSTTPVVKQMLEAQRSMLSPKNLLFMQTY